MPSPELIKAFDDEIEKHRKEASGMLGFAQAVLIFGIFVLFIYVVPGIAERMLPSIENETKARAEAYDKAVSHYETKYATVFHSISKEQYEEYEKTGKVDEKIRDARKLSMMDKGKGSSFAQLFASLKVEDTKIETVLKLLPYVIGVALAGFLFTYRLHVIAAKELAMKKFDILGQSREGIENSAYPEQTPRQGE